MRKQKKNSNVSHVYSETLLMNNKAPFAFKEAYKSLRTNFNFLTNSSNIKCVAITSSIPNEGKSTVAINLATTLAETGLRVILVDCDLRNPSLHRYLRIKNPKGFGVSDYLGKRTTLEKCIINDPKFRFLLVPAGTIPPNPTELLGSDRMTDLLNYFKDNADVVICDAPPVGVVTDASVLANKCDGVLMVVKQKFANKETVLNAKNQLINGGAKIIGAILNQYNIVEDQKNGYGHYGSYSYDYSGDKE